MTDDTLTVRHVAVHHGATPLVEASDLRLEPGRPVTVVGESGSGKSVLAHALMGTLPPELRAEGTMVWGGARLDLADQRGRRRLWGHDLALLPQEPAAALDPTMRVRGQVAEGVRGDDVRRRTSLRLADERLQRLGLAGAGAAYPHTLSGGMAQRVAYAAATIGGARVLLVDEPSKGLDPASLDRLAGLLLAHVADGGLLLTITHDLRLARRLGGDALVVRGAAVVERGPVERVLDEPGHAYTRRLVDAEPGRWSFPWMRTTPPVNLAAPPVVAARSVSKAYAGVPVLRDVSLEVRPGQRWALVGPSGVGKTTLGNVLLRLTGVDAGEVAHGESASPGRLQKLYQDPASSFPARVPLRVALRDVARRHRVDDVRVAALLEQVGLTPGLLDRRPAQVSGGELQRVAVVRALLLRPVVVLADEPTSRLDLATQQTTMDRLMSELDGSGCALVLITHDPDLAAAVTDRRLDLTPREREDAPGWDSGLSRARTRDPAAAPAPGRPSRGRWPR